MKTQNEMPEKLQEVFETSAWEILAVDYESLPEDKKFWVQFYFDNCAWIKYSMDLDQNDVLPRDVSWKKLMGYLVREEDKRAWESHDELQLIRHDYGFGECGEQDEM